MICLFFPGSAVNYLQTTSFLWGICHFILFLLSEWLLCSTVGIFAPARIPALAFPCRGMEGQGGLLLQALHVGMWKGRMLHINRVKHHSFELKCAWNLERNKIREMKEIICNKFSLQFQKNNKTSAIQSIYFVELCINSKYPKYFQCSKPVKYRYGDYYICRVTMYFFWSHLNITSLRESETEKDLLYVWLMSGIFWQLWLF